MKIVVIDYGSGNLNSVAKAFEKMALQTMAKTQVIISHKATDIKNASHIILPGQGAFDDCIGNLKRDESLYLALQEAVLTQAKPFFGICVGMQLLAEYGLENGKHEGLGWLGGFVDKLQPFGENYKIPHMGWNNIAVKKPHPVFHQQDGQDVYFVHSWVMRQLPEDYILTTTDYGDNFISAVGKDNIVATQFHPEKSQKVGQNIIANFLTWKV